MNPLAYIVRVTGPCHENWGQMHPQPGGRFCDSCQKTVTDFTGMTDDEVVRFLLRNPGSCGRFQMRQLGRPLVPCAPQPASIWPRAVAASLLLAATAGSAAAQTTPPRNPEIPWCDTPVATQPAIMPTEGVEPVATDSARTNPDDAAWIDTTGSDVQIIGDTIIAKLWDAEPKRCAPVTAGPVLIQWNPEYMILSGMTSMRLIPEPTLPPVKSMLPNTALAPHPAKSPNLPPEPDRSPAALPKREDSEDQNGDDANG